MKTENPNIHDQLDQDLTSASWKRSLIIPYCNILSRCFSNLIDERWVKKADGHIDFSKTRTIEISLRILAAEYIKEILDQYAFRIRGSSPLYPLLVIVPSSNSQLLDGEYAYKMSSAIDPSILSIDPLQLNYFTIKLAEALTNYNQDIMEILEERASFYQMIWVDERYSYIKHAIYSHFITEDNTLELKKGEFIVDMIDYPLAPGTAEHFRLETLGANHILYRAIQAKLSA